jgi:hypothetical protein
VEITDIPPACLIADSEWASTPTRQELFARLAFSRFGVAIGVLAFWGVIYCIILVCWMLNDYDEHIEWMRSGIKARE